MIQFKGSGIVGSSDTVTSTANQEFVPAPVGWVNATYSLYKVIFRNTQACHVKINGGTQIYLAAGQGFSSDLYDVKITSFIIVDAAITCNFIGYF